MFTNVVVLMNLVQNYAAAGVLSRLLIEWPGATQELFDQSID